MIASLTLLLAVILGGATDSGPTPCPAADATGYVLTEVHADGSFRCE